MHNQEDSGQGRFTKLKRWAAGRLRRTPRAASAPSSPKLICATRLRSASAENMASVSRNFMANESNSQPVSSSEINVPRVVINTEFDCSGARTRLGTNYLSRQPLRVTHPVMSQKVRESIVQDSSHLLKPSVSVPQPGVSKMSRKITSQELSPISSLDQGNESRLQQIERIMSEIRGRRIREGSQRRAQTSYVHPLNGNGNFPPNVTQNQHQSEQVTIEDCTPEEQGKLDVQNQKELEGTDSRNDRSEEVDKKQRVASLSAELNQLIIEIAEMDRHLLDKSDWWLRYAEYIKPYQNRLQNLIQRLIKIDVFGDVLHAACVEDENLAAMKRSYKMRAKDVLDKYGYRKREQKVDFDLQDAQNEEEESPSQEPEKTGNFQETDSGQPDEEWRCFTIWMDPDLEHSLSRTRCVSNMETRIVDAQSKADFASVGFRDLLDRVKALEEKSHKCDPNIYQRLNILETSTEVLRQTGAARQDVECIQREILEYKNDRDKAGACLKSIEKKSDELQVKIEKMDTLLKNVCRTLGGEDNVLSSTTQPGPNWGSAVLSRENTPPPKQKHSLLEER